MLCGRCGRAPARRSDPLYFAMARKSHSSGADAIKCYAVERWGALWRQGARLVRQRAAVTGRWASSCGCSSDMSATDCCAAPQRRLTAQEAALAEGATDGRGATACICAWQAADGK